MELEDLKELIELLRDTDITELQVEKEGTKVKIKREKMLSSLDLPGHKSAATPDASAGTPPCR